MEFAYNSLWKLSLCSLNELSHFEFSPVSCLQAVCVEVEKSERVKEKFQEDVNKVKQQITLRKHKTAEEEKSMCLGLFRIM